jgi:uncharacterized repeat protein (TIGR03803 family)
VFDLAGNLYGVGGPGIYGCGTLYQLSTANNWNPTTIYSFTGISDGCNPQPPLVFDAVGNLYGTTYGGGNPSCPAGSCGTVFELSPNVDGSWSETTLYKFSGPDGGNPVANVTFDSAGNLWGTTLYGGSNNVGTVFRLTPSVNGWTETVLHSFGHGYDGANPYAGVILDLAGNVYGTTYAGGRNNLGTVFELRAPSWTEGILHNFGSISSDGNFPDAPLTLDVYGNLWGTTLQGGRGNSSGTVFWLTLSNGYWVEHKILFGGGNNAGRYPSGAVVLDASGNAYGTTQTGQYNEGVFYEIVP